VAGADEYGFSDVRLDDGEVMDSFLGQYYGTGEERRPPREVLTSADFEDASVLEGVLSESAGRRVEVRTPQRGGGRELVAMAVRNAELALTRRIEARESVATALEEVRDRCGLTATPHRIECYDVSNLQGSLAVASRVVFEDGRPCKNDYRKYRIREAVGGDDYACLREVMRRRLAKVDREPLPDLLMVDGGRGQLGVVTAALSDAGIEVDTLGLAKERDEESPSVRVRREGGLKAERIFLPGRTNPVHLPPSSKGLLLLQRVRDESHRFAIEFQRSLRSKMGLMSILEEIPGIGPGKRRALLKHLGSLRAVRDADVDALAAVPGVGAADAATIRGFFDALARPGQTVEEGASATGNEDAEEATPR
jgi:excinuclease ABC subunit C